MLCASLDARHLSNKGKWGGVGRNGYGNMRLGMLARGIYIQWPIFLKVHFKMPKQRYKTFVFLESVLYEESDGVALLQAYTVYVR